MKVVLQFKKKVRCSHNCLLYPSQKPNEVGTHSSTYFTDEKMLAIPQNLSDLVKATQPEKELKPRSKCTLLNLGLALSLHINIDSRGQW